METSPQGGAIHPERAHLTGLHSIRTAGARAVEPIRWHSRQACGLLCLLLIFVSQSGCTQRRPYEGKSVAELTQMLESDDSIKQVQGAFGLSKLGTQARVATPALVKALTSRHTAVRENAALAMGNVGPDSEVAVPALIEALRDKEMTVRRQAAIALGRLGPAAAAARPALEKTSHDPDRLVRAAAVQALGQIRK